MSDEKVKWALMNQKSDFVEFLDVILNDTDEEEWRNLLRTKKEEYEGKRK